MTDHTPPPLPTARQLMTEPALVLECEMDLFDAVDGLVRLKLSAAPVIGLDRKLCGILTEKDCLRILSSLTYDPDPGRGTVLHYQSEIRSVCEPEMDLFRVADLFLANNFPMLPVVENGDLVGTISRADMLRGIQALGRAADRRQERFEQRAGQQADRPRSIEALQNAAANTTTDQFVRLVGRKQQKP